MWLSEDATGVIPKIVYDIASSQLIGQVLPIDENTGISITKTYMALSYEDIKKHLTDESANKSILAYIVVAQPSDEKSPPFLLSIYGTDNKFKSAQIMNRWKFVRAELAKYVFNLSNFVKHTYIATVFHTVLHGNIYPLYRISIKFYRQCRYRFNLLLASLYFLLQVWH